MFQLLYMIEPLHYAVRSSLAVAMMRFIEDQQRDPSQAYEAVNQSIKKDLVCAHYDIHIEQRISPHFLRLPGVDFVIARQCFDYICISKTTSNDLGLLICQCNIGRQEPHNL